MIINTSTYLLNSINFLKQEFPSGWFANWQNELYNVLGSQDHTEIIPAELIDNIESHSNVFSLKISNVRDQLMQNFNYFILSGEYLDKAKCIEEIQLLKEQIKSISEEIPQILSDEFDEEEGLTIESLLAFIYNDFEEYFYSPIKRAVNVLEYFVKIVNLNILITDNEYLFNISANNKQNNNNEEDDDDLGNQQVKFLLVNMQIATIDHRLSLASLAKLLVHKNYFDDDEIRGVFSQKPFYILLQEKCLFLIKKLIFRLGQDTITQGFYTQGATQNILSVDEIQLTYLNKLYQRSITHYKDDNLNTLDIEEVREKISKNAKISYNDYHKTIKHYKDKEKSPEYIEGIVKKFEEDNRITDCKNYFDEVAYKKSYNYLLNNLFSALITEDQDPTTIERVFKKIKGVQDQTGIRNYFPYYIYSCYLSNKIQNRIMDHGSSYNITDQINKLKSSLQTLDKNFEWCQQRQFIPFCLPSEESRESIEVLDGDAKIKFELFIASSFLLPFNYRKKKKIIEELNQTYHLHNTQLKLIETTNEKMKELKELKDEIKDQQRRYIEIISVFSAIVIFASGAIQILKDSNDILKATVITCMFALSLIIFVFFIFSLTKASENQYFKRNWLVSLFLMGISITTIILYANTERKKSDNFNSTLVKEITKKLDYQVRKTKPANDSTETKRANVLKKKKNKSS